MRRALCSYKDHAEKRQAIIRRLSRQSKGLGYWAAFDAQKYEKVSKPAPEPEVKEVAGEF